MEEYFNISTEDDQTLVLELKGFWTESIVDHVGSALVQEFKTFVDNFKKSKFIVLANLTAFGMPSAKTKGYIGQCMKYGVQNNMYKSVQVLPRTTLKMGIDKTAKEVGEDRFRVAVKTVAEAQSLVRELKKEIQA